MKINLPWLLLMCVAFSYAQTISLPQRLINYTVVTDGGGIYDQGTDQLGMWANAFGTANKQSLVFRAFDSNGDGTGTAVTMDAGDSFKITLAAKRAWGEIGVALLNNPTTATWADRKSNYTAYCILSGPNGESGAWTNWKAHSADGGSETFSVGGNETTETDFVITFSITASDKITIDVNGESKVLTVASPNSTHFSVWLNDDWTGNANSNIYLKPTTELVQATLSLDNLARFSNTLDSNIFTDKVKFKSPLSENINWALHDLTGRTLQNGITRKTESTIRFNAPPKGIYLLEVRSKSLANREVFKLIKN
jgi:hypothetical protein